jgi:DNA adenine methylase
MRPFLRWAGGKRWLAANRPSNLADRRYVEPFLGGGAYFFAADASKATLSDTNAYLVNAYVWMRDDPTGLFRLLTRHFDAHCTEHYYDVRRTLCESGLQAAADFIYLNRACFNGLFRVNLKGRFNVPVGTKVYTLEHESEFIQWGQRLESADILQSDFEPVIDQTDEGDFVFLDPPYTVKHNNNGFIEYNEEIFSWNDQVRLHASVERAVSRGADFMLTNADHQTVRDLYAGSFKLESVARGSEMAGKTAFRGKTTELIVTPYGRPLP